MEGEKERRSYEEEKEGRERSAGRVKGGKRNYCMCIFQHMYMYIASLSLSIGVLSLIPLIYRH